MFAKPSLSAGYFGRVHKIFCGIFDSIYKIYWKDKEKNKKMIKFVLTHIKTLKQMIHLIISHSCFKTGIFFGTECCMYSLRQKQEQLAAEL
jgi:hypothetical protein